MAAVATLLSVCFGTLPPCPSGTGLHCIAELAGDITGMPSSIAVSHDDRLAAVASLESGLRVYNMSTGAALILPDYTDARAAAFSPDAGKVAVAPEAGSVAVVNLITGTEVWSDTSKWYCTSIAYSPDGTRVASGHISGSIYIWNAATGDLVLSLTGGHTHPVAGLTYTLDRGRLISAASDLRLVVWNATTGAVLKTLMHHRSPPDVSHVSPDGQYFASLGTRSDDAVHIYKLGDYTLHKKISNTMDTRAISFSSDGSKLVVVGSGDMEVYSVQTGSLLTKYAMPSTDTTAVSYFHTSDTILTAEGRINSSNSRILVWADVVEPPPTK